MIPKRLFDLFVSGIGLLLLSPLLVAVAVAIKLDSPGPVFFRQVRIGRAGKPFRIHKYRTMRVALSGETREITVGRDPRITRIGHHLRRSKIDELPQLFDVFRGAMSIVGPRPEVPRYVEHYADSLRDIILSVRPGITDESSLHFIDEAELLSHQDDPECYYIEHIIPIKNSYHAKYVDNLSLSRDITILLNTLRRVLARVH
ncbi:sugar transferase [Sphingomonas sp. LR60]|uniref:sugar transferase n=1 Tax=Sphingomonas sp. LR60 TaxID=3050233 RepID=UPI002FE19F34